MLNSVMTNADVLKQFDKKVYGHKEAKIMLINAMNRARSRANLEFDAKVTEGLPKLRNLLLVGESGTGKTHLVESLSQILNFAFIRVDATQILPSGGDKSGMTISNLIDFIVQSCKHYNSTNVMSRNLDRCIRECVVFVDEIDKLAYAHDSSGNWSKHIQHNLLQLVEGKTDLGELTFIFAGAFTDAFKHQKTLKTKQSVGFLHQKAEELDEEDWDEWIVKQGIVPELAGRISYVSKLDNLSYDDYLTILNKHIVPDAKLELFRLGICKFNLNEKDQDRIVKKALRSNQGVRMLRKEVLKIVSDLEFNYDAHIISHNVNIER